MADIDALFDDFARRHARGGSPDPAPFLDAAGPDADALAALIDGLLSATPAPDPDAAAVEAMRAWLEGRSPLLAVRHLRGVRRAQVVDAVIAGAGLPDRVRDRVADHYHRLEAGLLPVGGLDAAVRAVLAGVLGAPLERLPPWRPAAGPAAVLMRGETVAAVPEIPAARPPADAADAEVDRLFGYRP